MPYNPTMFNNNFGAVLHKPRDLRITEIPIPEPDYGEVLLEVRSVGICGSDVHYFQHGNIGKYVIEEPMVLGHEASGVVIAQGKGVTNLDVGDRVAVEPGVPCRFCSVCKSGRYNLCEDVRFLATPPVNGALCKYLVHAAEFCHKLPDHLSFDDGALMEPLSVGIHACRRGKVSSGTKLLIMGAGPIGLATLLAAKHSGAGMVAITDVRDDRLEFSKTIGADIAFNVDTGIGGEPELFSETPLFDVAIDCTGMESAIRTSIKKVKPGGAVVLVGMGGDDINLPILETSTREIDLLGVFRYANTYPEASELLASSELDLKTLITHTFTLQEANAAFALAENKRSGVIKIIINP
jgi:L-iditol 2-dehydrogenase